MSAQPVTNELIYEVLKSVQTQVSVVREDTEMLKSRASSHDRRLGEVLVAMGDQNERMDRLEFQMRQLEQRMDALEAFNGGDSIQ